MSDASDQTARARMPEAGSEVPVPLELTLRTRHKLNPVGAVPSGRTTPALTWAVQHTARRMGSNLKFTWG
jgi:hypothetical protein